MFCWSMKKFPMVAADGDPGYNMCTASTLWADMSFICLAFLKEGGVSSLSASHKFLKMRDRDLDQLKFLRSAKLNYMRCSICTRRRYFKMGFDYSTNEKVRKHRKSFLNVQSYTCFIQTFERWYQSFFLSIVFVWTENLCQTAFDGTISRPELLE